MAGAGGRGVYNGSMNPASSGFTILVALFSLVLGLSIHEAAHAYVSFRLGDTTAYDLGRVSFNPLRHIDPVNTLLLPVVTLIFFGVPLLAARPVPFNPARVRFGDYGAAMMAAAGPLVNLFLAVVGGVLLKLSGGVGSNWLLVFITVNTAMGIFNLVPIPPLDGSRVLYALAPEPVRDFMSRIEPYGIFIVFGLVLLPIGFSGLLFRLNLHFINLLT